MVFFLSRSRFNTGLVILYRVLDDSICLSNSYIYIYIYIGCTGSWLVPSESRRYRLIAVNGVFMVALLVDEHRL